MGGLSNNNDGVVNNNNNGVVNNSGGVAQNIATGLTAGLGLFNGFGNPFDAIQYQDVGLVIKAKPTITNDGYVEIKMNFENSDVLSSGIDALNLTPTFVQRTLNTVARIQDGVTAVVAGVNQDSRGESRRYAGARDAPADRQALLHPATAVQPDRHYHHRHPAHSPLRRHHSE